MWYNDYTPFSTDVQYENEEYVMNSYQKLGTVPEVSLFEYSNFEHGYFHVHLFSRPKSNISSHSHTCCHLIILCEGDLTVQSMGTDFIIPKGAVYLQPANIPHSLISKNGYKQFGINMEPKGELKNCFLKPIVLELPEIMSIVYRLSALDSNDRFYGLEVESLCNHIIYAVASSVNKCGEDPLKFGILKYIENFASLRFSVTDMAHELLTSPSNLERNCRKFFGVGALALYNRKRFERACILLTKDEMSVREVAQELGFDESSNFTAFFKRYANISPTEYRKRYY